MTWPSPPGPGGPAPPSGPPGGYGVGLPPGVAPDTGGLDGGGGVTDPLAYVSLALGAVGLATAFCCWPLMFAIALGGIVTGIIALVRIHAEPSQLQGRNVAITGIVLSLLAPISYILLIVFFGALSFLPALFP